MNLATTVYKLEPVLDDPRFEGFGTGRVPSLRGKMSLPEDFLPDSSTGWEPPRLAPIWKPLKVIGRVRPFNDFPCVSMRIPAFSQRAVDALRDYLEANGELLPLLSELGDYYAYNITTLVPAFDAQRSDASWMNEWVAMTIRRYEFFPDLVEGLSIFQFPEHPGRAYVTDPFVARVHDAGLKGFEFIKVWPLPPSVNSSQIQRQKAKEMRVLKAESVTIHLPLNSSKATKNETEKVNLLMDELDALLTKPVAELSAPAVGSLERHSFRKGECILILSCPNADALVAELLPWVRSIAWPSKPRILKRYGEYDDDTAREVEVEF